MEHTHRQLGEGSELFWLKELPDPCDRHTSGQADVLGICFSI